MPILEKIAAVFAFLRTPCITVYECEYDWATWALSWNDLSAGTISCNWQFLPTVEWMSE